MDLSRPSQSNTEITEDCIAAVDEIIRANPRISTRNNNYELSLSKETIHTTVHQYSRFIMQ